MRPRLLVAVVVIVAAAAVILLARPSEEHALAALQADALATWTPQQPAGWRSLGRSADEARGMRPASVRSSFEVQRNGDDVYGTALVAARRAGWSVHDIDRRALSAPVRRTATTRKSGPGGQELRGVVVLAAPPDGAASTDELTIELTAVEATG